MSNFLDVCRKTLELEAEYLETPNSCTINRAMELITNAYQLGCQESDEQKLRERYAGLAMQALISNSDESVLRHKEEAMRNAVDFADALIAELRRDK